MTARGKEQERNHPVFLAGCGRSGTSYLRTLVDAHPAVWMPSETLCLVDYLRGWDRLPGRLREWLLFHEPQVRCWYSGPPVRGRPAAETIEAMHQYETNRAGARIWGQKTPRFVRSIPLLRAAFPTSRWILLHRDPRAVVASMLASGQHTHRVRAAARRWNLDNAPLLELVDEDIPWLTIVAYETLVTDFDRTMAELWEFLELPAVDRADLLAAAEPVFFSRSRFPINTVRGSMQPRPELLDRWHDELTPAEIDHVQRVCAAGMEQLGYSPVPTTGVEDGRIRGDGIGALRELRIIARYLWYWPEYPLFVALRTLVLAVARTIARRGLGG